ncbi:MAG: histidinol-phosphate aminotransferase [Myxococcota bacterium]|jgi:histidinol-phosphate aminotransferase
MTSPIESGIVEAQEQTEGTQPSAPPIPSKHTQNLRPYRPVSSLERIDPHANPEPLKLDWNESTIPPSPLVIERIQAFLGNTHHLNWYPDQRAAALTQRLSSYTGQPESRILVTSGSDAALENLCQTYLGPHDEVVVPSPSYTHFLVYAGARGSRIRTVYGDDPFTLDVDSVLRAITFKTKMVYLVSPCNPTGIIWPASVVARIARAAPQALIVVDEAYHEFCGESAVGLVETYSNVAVTRTFSKSFGIAGLRVGYLMASEAVINDVRRIFNPKSVNVLGQIAATAALDDLEYLYSYVADVTTAKPILADWFRSNGFHVVSTPANFLMVKVPHTGTFIQLLEDEGVFIRDRSMQRQLERYVRISVGTVEQTHELCRRLERVIAQLPTFA